MLTIEEINTLLEALDAWESQPTSSAAIGGMLGMALLGKEKGDAYMEEAMDKSKSEVELRRERSIMLKAKLVELKRAVRSEQEFAR